MSFKTVVRFIQYNPKYNPKCSFKRWNWKHSSKPTKQLPECILLPQRDKRYMTKAPHTEAWQNHYPNCTQSWYRGRVKYLSWTLLNNHHGNHKISQASKVSYLACSDEEWRVKNGHKVLCNYLNFQMIIHSKGKWLSIEILNRKFALFDKWLWISSCTVHFSLLKHSQAFSGQ